MKSARTSHAGSVFSVLGDLQYASAGVSGAALALAYDATTYPLSLRQCCCVPPARFIAFVVANETDRRNGMNRPGPEAARGLKMTPSRHLAAAQQRIALSSTMEVGWALRHVGGVPQQQNGPTQH
jgi:hypothetical protein